MDNDINLSPVNEYYELVNQEAERLHRSQSNKYIKDKSMNSSDDYSEINTERDNNEDENAIIIPKTGHNDLMKFNMTTQDHFHTTQPDKLIIKKEIEEKERNFLDEISMDNDVNGKIMINDSV